MKNLVNIFDLDMTLIDSSHRQGSTLEYWIENSTRENIFLDKLMPISNIFFELDKTNFTNIAVTAREMSIHDFDFLLYHNINFKMILHRGSSKELDEVLKRSKLQELFESGFYKPFLAFDDKQENLQVFEEFGFKTFDAKLLNKDLKKFKVL